MAFVVKDRVKVTTTTTGTGTLTLGSAVAGFQSFSVIGSGNTTTYAIVDTATGSWEVGIGTYTSSGTTLTRTTVLESSNSGSLVNFAAGSKEVFVTYAAERAVIAAAGSSGQLLVATSDALSSWQSPSAISVGYATNAGSATTASSATSAATATYAAGLQQAGAAWSVPIGGSSPTDGQVLAYNSTFNEFRPATASGGGGVTSIIAGTGISISSTGPGGTGAVTVSTSGGGGGNPPPGGSFGATLSTGVMVSTGYISYPPEFSPTGPWAFAALDAVVVTDSSSQPFSPPFPWSYNGWSVAFATSYGTMYMHWYTVTNSSFGSLDPSGFYVSGLGSLSATALFFTSSNSMVPSGSAGYLLNGSLFTNDSGPGIEFPLVMAPPSGTFTLFDSKQLVFFQSGDTFTPATGVTETATAAGPLRVALYSIPSTFVKTSPPVTPNLTYGGSWAVGIVGIVGNSYVP